MTATLTAAQFQAMPLLRAFISVDFTTGDLVRHEVRRDPSTGLTLTAKSQTAKQGATPNG